MKNFIVTDIGGTQIRAARFASGSGTPQIIKKTSTIGSDGTPLERMLDLIAAIWPEGGQVSAICTAAPGPIDPYEGIVYEAPNIPGWVNVPLKKHLTERFHVPAAIGNDANLAALGEWKYGAGQGHHHIIYITVSTGIGAGVISNDQLLVGAHGLATELGHITVDPGGPLCGCGQPGHLESFAAGPSIARWVTEQIQSGTPSILKRDMPLTAKEVAAAAKSGDELAIAALARAGTYLGRTVADFLHIFNPSAIIFGGGVSQSGAFLFEPLKAAMRKSVLSDKYLDGLVITTAALGDEAGLLGALTLAQSLVGS